MTIVNGTFNTDLSGWQSNEKVSWDNGQAKFNACGPVRAYMSQRFVIDNPILSFDWVTANNLCCPPFCQGVPVFILELILHDIIDEIPVDTTVISEMFPGGAGSGGSGTKIKDISQYLGRDATLQFRDSGGGYCCGGQGWYIMTIDNVIVSPNWGTFRVSSVPGKAAIYIDGSFVNETPDTGSIDLTDIAVGSRTITLRKTDYYDYSQTIDIYPGRIYEVSHTLNPEVACLTFYTDPPEAKIYLSDRNGQTLTDTGFTTFKQICDLFWGDYKWKLVKPGYEPKSGIAHIINATGATISETLTFIDIGCIYFETNPPDAEIILDGNDTHLVTPNKICNLPLGQHCYELILPGHITISDCVTLTSTSGEAISTDLVQLVLNTIDVSPSAPSITVGNTQQFTATCKDQNNTVMTCPQIIWDTSDHSVGTISSTGLFTASSTNTGTVTVTATSETIVGSAVVTVTTVPPVQAGFGGAGMFLIAGLAVGAIYMTRKKKEERK